MSSEQPESPFGTTHASRTACYFRSGCAVKGDAIGRCAARLLAAACALIAALTMTTAAIGQERADTKKLSEAKRLFYQAESLRNAGDCERALEYYRKSRALVPSVHNTLNAGICLEDLGRLDEALERYERLLREMGPELTEREQELLPSRMRRLRRFVGSIQISANTEASVVVSTRPRGSLPLAAPLRVMPGRHKVIVYKEGFESFEQTVDVRQGQVVVIDATLKELRYAGTVRVTDRELVGLGIFLDGVRVGSAPWVGRVAPGRHVVWFGDGQRGSAPIELTVLRGRTISATASVAELGGAVVLRVDPPTAELRIDGSLVADGSWSGRLPLGSYVVEARQEGYFATERELVIRRDAPVQHNLVLEVDADHPRWELHPGSVLIDAFGGAALTWSLGTGAEASCDVGACVAEGVGHGGMVGLTAGFEFESGLVLEVAGGYLGLRKDVIRRLSRGFEAANGTVVATTYELRDELRINGAFLLSGVGYHARADWFELRTHLLFGTFVEVASDTVTGVAGAANHQVGARAPDSGEGVDGANLMIMPQVTVGARIDAWRIYAGLAAAALLLEGPEHEALDVVVDASECRPINISQIDCAPPTTIAPERAYGRALVLLPMIGVGYGF